ncbi:MAG: SCO family protein [Isosphaeraceae bacterium]|nr:SCO family protein [Isosphaeraceae bacterium]
MAWVAMLFVLGASPLADIGPAPATRLVDERGARFALDELRGKAVVVSFVYTTCTGSCPATTQRLRLVAKALRDEGLWGEQVHFVSITLDPTRDRPEVLADYARLYKADLGAWHFLTGPPAQVADVIAAWGMWAKVGPSGVLDHPSRVFLVDPRGRQREIYNLEFLTPKAVVQDAKTVLREKHVDAPPPVQRERAEVMP